MFQMQEACFKWSRRVVANGEGMFEAKEACSQQKRPVFKRGGRAEAGCFKRRTRDSSEG